jgi:thiamine monophosphate kinase
MPEHPEEMYTIINQCGFKEEITSALLEQFESLLEEQQYKLQYAYLSDEEFSIFITAFYIAKHKLDAEIEAIVKEIEEFNTLAQEENQEEYKEECKDFVRETIKNNLKPKFEELKEIVEKHKKSKTPIKLGNLIRKRGKKETT